MDLLKQKFMIYWEINLHPLKTTQPVLKILVMGFIYLKFILEKKCKKLKLLSKNKR